MLPSSLKTLVKVTGPEKDTFLDRWALSAFWGTLRIWRQRLALFGRRERTKKDSACRSIFHGLSPYHCPCLVPVYRLPETPEERKSGAPFAELNESKVAEKEVKYLKKRKRLETSEQADDAALGVRRSVRLKCRPAPSYSERTRKDWTVAKRKKGD